MTIEHKDFESKGAFVALEDGKKVGEMTYSNVGPGKIIIDHTEVHESQKGKGVGKQIFDQLIDHAKANDIKILPLCPFAKAMFDKNPDLKEFLF